MESLKEKSKVNPKYLTKDSEKMRDEIEKQSKKDSDDPTAYKSHPKGDWKADYSSSGKRYKTKTSKWTKKYKKMYEDLDHELGFLPESVETFLEEQLNNSEKILIEFIEEILQEKKRSNSTKALKNKAEKSGAPLSALRTIYNKGLAAWRTGHRPGTSPHQWAMARVNSVLAGGPARKVDAKQWDQIKKHRGKKRKKQKD